MHALRFGRLAASALVFALLGACASGGGGGGGGGGSPVSPPPPPPPPPATFPPPAPPHAPGDYPHVNSNEFNANWGVAGARAQAAWQAGATGAGVLIGVIDDGIHPNHPELTGRISADSIDIVPGRDALVTDQSHGSELAAIMAGNYNGQQTVGLAFDAQILAIRADNGTGAFSHTDLAAAVNYAREKGVHVINLSLGSASPSSPAMQQAIADATAAGIIFVISAGNCGQGGSHCSGGAATEPNYPGFNAIFPEISNGLIIIAGGLNSNGTLNTVSNPPGSAAEFYMVAPGWEIIVPDFGPVGPVPGYQTCGLGPNGDLCRIQGTSYASPIITAAVALVKDGFPGLTPAQIVELLFITADDEGAPGTDSLYGRGRLNIARAFEPVGTLSAPLASLEVSPMSVVGALGPAFGDGFSHSGAWNVASFDYFDRTYAMDLSRAWMRAQAGPARVAQAPLLWRSEAAGPVRVQAAFAESVAPDSFRTAIARADLEQNPMRIEAEIAPGFTAAFAAHGARAEYDDNGVVSHLDAVQSDMSLRLTRRLVKGVSLSLINESGRTASGVAFMPGVERSATAARASFDLPRVGLDLTFGAVREDQGVLGMIWSSGFGATPGGETRFGGIGFHADVTSVWRVSGSAEFGVADMGPSGWLQVIEPLRTTAFSLKAQARPDWLNGALTFTVTQPLRVEDGVMAFLAPTATNYGRESLSYELRAFSPAPSGRELRLGVGYTYWRGDVFSAFGEALYVLEPGHVRNQDAESMLRFGLRVAH